jgi:hypothetical protein
MEFNPLRLSPAASLTEPTLGSGGNFRRSAIASFGDTGGCRKKPASMASNILNPFSKDKANQLRDGSDFVGLKLRGFEPSGFFVVEATAAVVGFFQPAIDQP